MDGAAATRMRCPTCGAPQEWSPTCRRCRSDLSLLWSAFSCLHEHRRQCIRALEAGQTELALGHALRCQELLPDDDSARLLALCALARDEFQSALALAQQAGS